MLRFSHALDCSLLAVLSAAVPATTSTPQQSFRQIAQQADSARSADRLNVAIGLYRQGVRLHPAWDEGWWWLGNLFYDEDRFPEAQASFTRFLISRQNRAQPLP